VTALVVIVTLAAAIGVVSRQSEIDDLTTKNEALAVSRARAVRQRDAGQYELGGAMLFAANCATCHGSVGGGGVGPRLFGGVVVGRLSEDGEIAKVTGGGPVMPAFGAVLSPEEIRQVVAYTRAH
jgi:mono/diheme cytochrome c family protein